MIQFNLLPDVKIEYIKTQHRRRMVILISAFASGLALIVFIVLFLFVRVNQPRYMNALTKDIKTETNKIQSTPDLDKILTIQSQLNSLPGLHDKKVVTSRLIDYLNRLTPNQATISDATIDFEANTLNLEGNADTLATVNKFTDTLKFTDFKVNSEGGASGKAFKDVVLKSFAVSSNSGSGPGGLTYEISVAFDPAIFAQHKNVPQGSEVVTLTVPKIISTRSATEQPTNLFAPQPQQQPAPGGQGQ